MPAVPRLAPDLAGSPPGGLTNTEGNTGMNLFNVAYDTLAKAEDAWGGDRRLMGAEQLLQIAQIEALLSISQELSRIHHEGINPEYLT